MGLTPGQIIDVRIARINRFGLGVAEAAGVALRVPGGLTDELVQVRVGRVRKGMCEVEIIKILDASTERRAAPCPVYGMCGGCDLQHMEYNAQLTLKMQWVREACTGLAAGVIHDIAPSPQEFGYRGRVTLHGDGKLIGYHRRGAQEIVPITACPLATAALNAKIAVTVPFSGTLELREAAGAGFVQPNALLNPELIRVVKTAAAGRKSQSILELYAGSGNLSFALAEVARTVLAIEGNASAHAEALAGKKLRDTPVARHIRFQHGEVSDAIFQLIQARESFDTIVADPPREGLGTLAGRLHLLSAERIVLISCELESFVRDAKALLAKDYRLDAVTPLDMFPQTRHVEIVGKFLKNPPSHPARH
jgi:tRNA/tmRNA/rRNA uracil-C5-methylase (TrmA/RlmC/RlmD family)